MLQSIRLRDFVIVAEAEIRFGSGFCVLSGETGAGKSILIDALGLALGARADSSVVREGARRADIVAEFAIGGDLLAWLREHELDGDDKQLLLRRVIDADGGSKAFVNGVQSTATTLRRIGEQLLEIHGQHASQSLMAPDGQRRLIDGYARLDERVRDAGSAWRIWREAREALERAQRDQRLLDLEREKLAWLLAELEPVKPIEGEWESLGAEQRRLANAASLIEGASAAAMSLGQDDDAIADRLHQIGQRLRALTRFDERLRASLEMVESAAIQASEAASELSSYAQSIDLDAERLAAVERRVELLFDLARKLRIEPDSLPSKLADTQRRLDDLEASRDEQALRRSVDEAWARYEAIATILSRERRHAAKQLASEVTTGIAELGMKGGSFEVSFEIGEASATGIDRIEFRIAAHAGVPARALSRVASGGELSRIALVISVCAARANPVPTLIFDEADAGVGGAVADAIGVLMRRLGQTCQVLSVTHLPQVAARAHHHLSVRKISRDNATTSEIRTLDPAQRVDEIARMLGGSRITATTRRHAREMLADDAHGA